MKFLKIHYKIHFESPFIVASGITGFGEFDQISVLSNNLPFIPPSSIRGRIKQAIREHLTENSRWPNYQICEGQKSGVEGAYCIPDFSKENHGVCILCRIFGMPGGEIKRGFDFSGAYFPKPILELLQNVYGNVPEASLIRHSRNRRDYLLRRAKEDALFSLGLSKPLVELEGSINETITHLRYNKEIRTFDFSVLLLGLRLVTEIGGGRNRGYGRCRFRIIKPQNWSKLIVDHIKNWKNGSP